MMTKIRALAAFLFTAMVVLAEAPASAQSNPRYIRFAGVPSAVKGALFTPDAPQKAPHVGILVMHRASNFLNTLACPELSRRGFMVLCMNPRSDNNEALVRWETIPIDVKAGMEFLKRRLSDHDLLSERRGERRGGMPGGEKASAVR